jgi:hypothetical protein
MPASWRGTIAQYVGRLHRSHEGKREVRVYDYADLPIPFDGRGRMEVDFLCERARLVIELDGHQHLADAEAYRRDRRKDARLQEQGYFVLRFLVEDLAKHLDDVLDAILRTLAHRERAIRPLRVSLDLASAGDGR